MTTADNINFTATATLPQGVAAGAVKFDIAYKLSSGATGYPNSATTDSTGLYLVDESDVLPNLATTTTLIDSTLIRPAATTLGQVVNLLDNNLNTISDFRIGSNNSGVGSYITFDFKAGNQVNLTGVELAPRQDSNFTRIKGTVVQGSNDNANWTTLTGAAGSTQDWQTFAVTSQVPYRYLRVINGGSWFGNLSELRFHGKVHAADVTAPVTTSNAPAAAVPPNTTITFSATDTSGSGVAATYYTLDGGAQQTGATVVLSTVGSHTLEFWSMDWAGNVEQKHTATVKVSPLDVSASVQMTQQGATLNRSTGKYVGSVTVTNTSGAALAGPLQLKLNALTAGITLDNASGTDAGAPYVTIAGGLAAGASVNVPLTFTNPNRALVTYTPALFQGAF